jgi:hypothetical protein
MINAIKKHGRNFGKYMFIGITWISLNIFFMWFSIDFIGLPTLIGSTIVVSILFVSKFYAYKLIKLFKLTFKEYFTIAIGFNLANILLMWLFVDTIKLPTVPSSTVIILTLFVLRYITFNKAESNRNQEYNELKL